MNDIMLHKGGVAKYRSSRVSRVPDLDRTSNTLVHFYDVPCPICDEENVAHSTDAVFFINMQLCCKACGVFFRPVVDRQWAGRKLQETQSSGGA